MLRISGVSCFFLMSSDSFVIRGKYRCNDYFTPFFDALILGNWCNNCSVDRIKKKGKRERK